MRMNRTTRYALACLSELSQHQRDWMLAAEIAGRHGMPAHYCYKVLALLARAELIESARGQGFRLSRPLNRITCLELIEACSEGAREDEALTVGLADSFKSKVDGLLQDLTLQDLVPA